MNADYGMEDDEDEEEAYYAAHQRLEEKKLTDAKGSRNRNGGEVMGSRAEKKLLLEMLENGNDG